MLTPQEFIARLPFPVAAIYADLEDASVAPPRQREAVYFTAYQLMRTVGLTLAGQYLTQDLPPNVKSKNISSFNRTLAGVRAPFFSDWTALLAALDKRRAEFGLDFLPEFGAAMQAVKQSRVDIPPDFKGNNNRYQNLTWLEALLALRNKAAHSGMSYDEPCREAVAEFRPHLDALLHAFAFLCDYELLALRSPLDDDEPLLQTLRGAAPPAAAPCEDMPDTLFAAFEHSPIVMRAPTGRVQALFPLFHSHIEGEPLHLYDGHYLRDDPKIPRRTVIYLGNSRKVSLDDNAPAGLQRDAPGQAAGNLQKMLTARNVPWHIKAADVAPWTMREFTRDYARRTLADLLGVKYLPECYLDRPRLSEPLRGLLTDAETPYRAMFLVGAAGSGKTALLADTVSRLLEDREEDAPEQLVFFLRGDGIVPEIEGANMLLANILHKIGLNPLDFPTFAALFAHLEDRAGEDRVTGRRFVIALDALNEAQHPVQVFREALELVATARAYPWVRVVFSVRDEFMWVWRGRQSGTTANPFYYMKDLFVPPPEDPQRPRRPEDPPAWDVPPFSQDEAAIVYGNYQAAKANDANRKACPTPWEQIARETRGGLLSVPLYLHLWMEAFDGREAPAVGGEAELFHAWLWDTRHKFAGLWERLTRVIDYMLQHGRMELSDADAHELQEAWEQHLTEHQRLHFSPLETACAAGVMQKRATEEGGGYRIPQQRVRELLIYERWREQDKKMSAASVKQWLELPPMGELEGALALVAHDLWNKDRPGEVAQFVGLSPLAREQWLAEPGAAPPVGTRAVERMLAQVLARRVETGESLKRRVGAMLAAVPEADAARVSSMLLFELRDRVEGLPVTAGLRGVWEGALSWLETGLAAHPDDTSWLQHAATIYIQLGGIYEAGGEGRRALEYYEKANAMMERRHAAEPQRADFARDVSVSLIKLADVWRAAGETSRALELYQRSLELRERLFAAEPQRADFARDVSVSCSKLGGLYLQAGETDQAKPYFQRDLEIAEQLYAAEPQRADFARDVAVSCHTMAQLAGGLETADGRRWFARGRDVLRQLRAENRMPDKQVAGYLQWLESNLEGLTEG